MARFVTQGTGLLHEPRILRPSLGRPVFVGRERARFRAFVAAPAGALDASALREGFLLTSVRDARRTVTLQVGAVDERAGLPDGSPLARVLVPADRYALYEVRLEVPAGPAALAAGGGRFALFDLAHPRLSPGRHSVVWIDHRWERFTFVFAADTHVAEAWDRIAADSFGLAPLEAGTEGQPADRLRRAFSRQAFTAGFIDPNRQWRDFIGEANARSRRGELDLIVLGGDLVDYQLPGNFGLFADMVTGRVPGCAELEAPLFTLPGNHDYRRFPYRPQVYPLDRCGLHDLQRDHFFRQARGERRTRLSIADARAVLAGDGGRHPLAEYLLTINPLVDDVLNLGRTKFVLLDTGRDVIRDLLHVRPRRWGNFLRAAVHSWIFPGSAGLTDGQAGRLARETEDEDATNVFLVFHAGLSGGSIGRGGADGGSPPLRSKGIPADADSLRARVRLEKTLLRSGFGRGGLFQNHLSLIRAAVKADRTTVGLSGHFHRPVVLRLDKSSGRIRIESPAAPAPAPSSSAASSFFLGGPALGHANFRSDPPGRPGYIVIEVAGDRIVSVQDKGLDPFPGDYLRVHVRCPEDGAGRLSVTLEPAAAGIGARPEELAADVTFVVFSRPRRGAPGRFPFSIETETPDVVRPGKPQWVNPADRKAFFGGLRPAYLQTFRCKPGPEQGFRILATGRRGGRPTVVVVVEVLDRRNGVWRPVSVKWHPLSMRVRIRPSKADGEGS
jgi:hypothetical protein